MAISADSAILSLLKVYYREGVENLLFRNSPVLKKIKKTRVEGREQSFAAMYGTGGAVSGNFQTAKAAAAAVSRSVEFKTVPGQLFSVYSVNAKEVVASASNAGAYMKVAGVKMFAASEALRKTMALALYGSGYGEVSKVKAATVTANTEFDMELPAYALMSVDVGTKLDIKASVITGTVKGTLEVTAVKTNSVSVKSPVGFTIAADDWACLAGSVDAAGNPLLPVGLAGWLPNVADRTGADWTAYINKPFFGVNRSVAAERLAGGFVLQTSGETITAVVQKAIQKARRQGSQADMIVMNDEDFLTMTATLETSNTFFTATATKEKKKGAIGFDEVSASFSTNYVENIIDDPYCPKGTIYVLDSEAVELFSYTNVDKLDDGVAGNNPGKEDIMDADGHATDPAQLLIDDYLTVSPGADSVNGPSILVTMNIFGSFAVTNPSVCVVAKLV